MKTPFIMDPDVYDAIDFVSELEGGLLRGAVYVNARGHHTMSGTPREGDRCGCMIGAAHYAGVYGDTTGAYIGCDAYPTLTPRYVVFDDAHRRLTPGGSTRLPWPIVAEEMGVVRGGAQ